MRRSATPRDVRLAQLAARQHFLALCNAHGIPRPLVNTMVEGFEVDFCWPECWLIVETDGHAHHGTRAAFERDRARDARLTELGWRVMRFTDRQVRTDAPSVAAVVMRARAHRA